MSEMELMEYIEKKYNRVTSVQPNSNGISSPIYTKNSEFQIELDIQNQIKKEKEVKAKSKSSERFRDYSIMRPCAVVRPTI